MEDFHTPHQPEPIHNVAHSLHPHHQALTHDGPSRGPKDGSEKHSLSSGDSGPLVHHLKPSDWQDHFRHEKAKSEKASTAKEKHGLPALELSGHEGLKQALSNEKLAPADRLEAARSLVKDGVHSVQFKDSQGKDHDYHLRLFNSGKVTITEGNQAVALGGGANTGIERQPHQQGRSAGAAASPAAGAETSHPHQSQAGSHIRAGGAGGEMREGHAGAGNAHLSNTARGREGGDHGVTARGGSATRNPDGSVSIKFTGCATDTDGHGAGRHGEDPHRRSGTSLARSDGQYLDTDKDNFVVLSPSVAAQYGIHVGDLGRLIRKDTGQSVPVVFGDTGHEGRRTAEASLAALRALGFRGVNGNNGVTGGQFEIVMTPRSGNGSGDVARNPQQIAARLERNNMVANSQ